MIGWVLENGFGRMTKGKQNNIKKSKKKTSKTKISISENSSVLVHRFKHYNIPFLLEQGEKTIPPIALIFTSGSLGNRGICIERTNHEVEKNMNSTNIVWSVSWDKVPGCGSEHAVVRTILKGVRLCLDTGADWDKKKNGPGILD